MNPTPLSKSSSRRLGAVARLALGLLCATDALAAGTVAAADKSASAPAARVSAASAAAAKAAAALLTQNQLRDCLAQKDRLRQDTDAALKAKADIGVAKVEVDRTGAALSDEANTLDRTSPEAVAAYNAKVDVRDKLIDAYQAKVDAYNKQADGVQSAQDTYAKSCENRRYDDRDLADVQRKKK